MIRGTKRRIDEFSINNSSKASLNASIHNRFDIEVINSETGELKTLAQAENVICDKLWTRLFTPNTYFTYIHYGTGTGVPASTDQNLFTYLGYGTAVDDSSGYDEETSAFWFRRKIQITETQAVDSILTEVGIGYSYGATSNSLCTHALITDMNGNTISIHKTSTDIVNIYATIYVHQNPNGYDNGHILISPEYINYIPKYLAGISLNLPNASFISNVYAGTIRGPRTGSWAPNPYQSVATSYDIVNKKITYTSSRISADGNNANGAICAVVGRNTDVSVPNGSYYKGIIPCMALLVGGSWYSGTHIIGESLGTGDGETAEFVTDFEFPENANVYVDGVLTTDVIVKKIGSSACLMCIDENSTPENIIPSPKSLVASRNDIPACFEIPVGEPVYLYNVNHEAGMYQLHSGYYVPISVYISDDMVNWEHLFSSAGSGFILPEDKKYKKFYKLVLAERDYGIHLMFVMASDIKNVIFSTPPADGAVITIDYDTQSIAKDENHVFDMTVELTLNEYTES